jgi:hypothetical protein
MADNTTQEKVEQKEKDGSIEDEGDGRKIPDSQFLATRTTATTKYAGTMFHSFDVRKNALYLLFE